MEEILTGTAPAARTAATFALSADSFVQLTAFAVYAILATALTLNGRSRLKRPLLQLIISSAGWMAASLLARAQSFDQVVYFQALTPVFSNIANQLVDRFHRRAMELYGKPA